MTSGYCLPQHPFRGAPLSFKSKFVCSAKRTMRGSAIGTPRFEAVAMLMRSSCWKSPVR